MIPTSTESVKVTDHPWISGPTSSIDRLPTQALLNLYGMLMSTPKARSYHITATWGDGQQLFSPDLRSSLETYHELLDIGAIKLTPQFWSTHIASNESATLELSDIQQATFEINVEPKLPNSMLAKLVKKEIFVRIKANRDIALTGLHCWHLLTQAYCYSAIAYRYQSFGIDAAEREFTTSEYLDLRDLTTQLSIGWIHALCHRAFNWTAGKQKETGMSDTKAAGLAIGSVIRQFTWANESTPAGEMYTRPKSLAVFGLERVFKDIFGIAPDTLYVLTPDIDYLKQCLVDKYALATT